MKEKTWEIRNLNTQKLELQEIESANGQNTPLWQSIFNLKSKEDFIAAKKALGLNEKDSNISLIKELYKKLAKQYHPDKGTICKDEAIFKVINNTYKFILDHSQILEDRAIPSVYTKQEHNEYFASAAMKLTNKQKELLVTRVFISCILNEGDATVEKFVSHLKDERKKHHYLVQESTICEVLSEVSRLLLNIGIVSKDFIEAKYQDKVDFVNRYTMASGTRTVVQYVSTLAIIHEATGLDLDVLIKFMYYDSLHVTNDEKDQLLKDLIRMDKNFALYRNDLKNYIRKCYHRTKNSEHAFDDFKTEMLKVFMISKDQGKTNELNNAIQVLHNELVQQQKISNQSIFRFVDQFFEMVGLGQYLPKIAEINITNKIDEKVLGQSIDVFSKNIDYNKLLQDKGKGLGVE